MDIIKNPPYEDLQRIYEKYFSLGYLNTDFTSKIFLIAYICYLTEQLKAKKPDVTHYQVIRKIADSSVSEDFIKGLAVVCSDFSYGCKNFPDNGKTAKEMPAEIKKILNTYVPF